MAFTRNRPTATEILSDSQPLIRDNFNSSDDSYGKDHYAFSDTSAENGLHNTVTNPEIRIVPPAMAPAHAPTDATHLSFYAMNTGGASPPLLQFSRGVSNAVPTPVTSIHSAATPTILNSGGQINIFDFSKISGIAIATMYLVNIQSGASNDVYDEEIIYWNSTGSVLLVHTIKTNTGFLNANAAGTTLRVQNTGLTNYTQVFWTLHFHRAS